MRIEPQAPAKSDAFAGPRDGSDRHQFHLPMIRKQFPHHSFIFHLRERAGRIQQKSARPQHFHGTFQNLPLKRRVVRRPPLQPVLHHIRIPAEHPLSRTGRVHEDLVKIRRINLGEPFRRLAGHTDIRKAEQFQILEQPLRSGTADIIGKQKPRAPQPRSEFCTLAARRGAQIQHPLARFDRKEGGRRHGAGFLQIIKPRVIIGVFRPSPAFGAADPCADIKPVRGPRYRIVRKTQDGGRLPWRPFPRIDPQARLDRSVEAGEIIRVFLAEKAPHLGQEPGRQRCSHMHLLPFPQNASSDLRHDGDTRQTAVRTDIIAVFPIIISFRILSCQGYLSDAGPFERYRHFSHYHTIPDLVPTGTRARRRSASAVSAPSHHTIPPFVPTRTIARRRSASAASVSFFTIIS